MLYKITAIVDINEEDPLMAEEIVDNALSAHGWSPSMVVANAIDAKEACRFQKHNDTQAEAIFQTVLRRNDQEGKR